jgi:hypothetical protein
MRFVRAPFFCALLLLVPMTAMAQAYKCKRSDGKTSFQDQPCDVGSTGGPVIISDPSPSSGEAPAPKKAGVPPAKRDKIPVVQPASGDEALKARNRQLEADNRAMACDRARRNLSVLKAQRPVYSTDKNGNKQYVEDANRQSALDTAQQGVAENCR